MQTGKKSLEWAIFLFITLTMMACTDEADSVVTTNETISNNDIEGTWFLTEISYDSSGVNISVSPVVVAYSLTLKFWENKQGQIISFDSGGTKVQNINWYIQGNVIILNSDNEDEEYIRCEFIDQHLCLKYAYTTLAGDQVLALYIFTKEE
ncbi:MAG: lipocalin family protein [Ignavibacteriaceae bacterium]